MDYFNRFNFFVLPTTGVSAPPNNDGLLRQRMYFRHEGQVSNTRIATPAKPYARVHGDTRDTGESTHT